MRQIFFDIETKNTFAEAGAREPEKLDLSVVAIYDSETDKYTSYSQEELGTLWPILEKADMLIGFNTDHFDIPLLNKYYSGDLTKIRSLDLLKEVKKSLGRRIKLDTLAEATLGKNKLADGLSAIRWWREGKYDKVREYCIEDVRITKELYDYALKNKTVKYKDAGTIKDIPLDVSRWEIEETKGAMTHTLPF